MPSSSLHKPSLQPRFRQWTAAKPIGLKRDADTGSQQPTLPMFHRLFVSLRAICGNRRGRSAAVAVVCPVFVGRPKINFSKLKNIVPFEVRQVILKRSLKLPLKEKNAPEIGRNFWSVLKLALIRRKLNEVNLIIRKALSIS